MRLAPLLVLAALAGSPGRADGSSTPAPPVPWHVVKGAPDPATRFRARIVGADGAPVGGAEVVVETGLGAEFARSDVSGTIDLPLPTASPVARAIVVAAGHGVTATPWATVLPGAGADLGTVRLRRAAEIRGRVADAEGRPVPAAWVEIDGSGAVGRDWESVVRHTDLEFAECDAATGEFRIDTLPAGRVAIAGGSATHGLASAVIDAPAADVVLVGAPFPDGPRFDVDLRLVPPDEASPGERVVAETTSTFVDPQPVSSGPPGDATALRFRVAPPVTLRLLAAPGHAPWSLRLDRVPRGPVEVPLRPLRNTARGGEVSLRGRVTADTAPVTWSDGDAASAPRGARFVVEARRSPGRRDPDDAPALVADTLTAPDGSFAFDGLVAGTYAVRVVRLDATFGDPWAAPVPAGWGTRLPDGTWRVPVASRGERLVRVVVPAAHRAAADFAVEAVAATWREGPYPCEVTSVAGGRPDVPETVVRVRGVPPAARIDVAVRARRGGVWSKRVVVVSEPGATPEARIPDFAPISGRVVHAGRPVPGALVEIRLAEGEGDGDFAVTDADGRFDVSGLDVGLGWIVSASAPGLAGWAHAAAGRVPVLVDLVPVRR